jgi:histidinol dehydrogenase
MTSKIVTVPLTARNAARCLAWRPRATDDALRQAARIVEDVRRRGDAALLAWTRKLDGGHLRASELAVSVSARHAALRRLDAEQLRTLQHALSNIQQVARRQLPRDWSLELEPGVRVGQHVTPLESVGCYVPGGRQALVSTLLMTAGPAKIAGVEKVMVACPHPNDAILAASEMLGVTKLFRLGGAQAIAAFAYGTRSVPRVDKIVGPGNRWVESAKRLVSCDCAVDFPAGPTELVVVAQEGNPDWIAADLIAQAEHGPDSLSLLLTPSARLARQVGRAIEQQLGRLPPSNAAQQSLRRRGSIFLTRSYAAAVEFANRLAPEHLSLPDRASVPAGLRHAGSIFLGAHTAQPLGDYATGSNHVLPTGQWARARGGLSAADFVKCIALQRVTRQGLASLGPVAAALARAENLAAHERAAHREQRSAS